MNRAFRTEYYPDMNGDDYGKKVLTVSCTVNNGKRFNSLTKEERKTLLKLLDVFRKQITVFMEEVSEGYYQTDK